MDEILWHRRESRRQTEKTNIVLQLRETPAYSKGGVPSQRYQARPDVALKVLPQAFTDDPDRLARFEREAKVLASCLHACAAGRWYHAV